MSNVRFPPIADIPLKVRFYRRFKTIILIPGLSLSMFVAGEELV
jgi:hypothetical protein